MKRFTTLWTVLSFILCPLMLLGILNAYISLKYEVEDARMFPNQNPIAVINLFDRHLQDVIVQSWILSAYFLVNGSVLVFLRRNLKRAAAPNTAINDAGKSHA